MGTVPWPEGWTGSARLVRFAAQIISPASYVAPTWLPSGSTHLTSQTDAGASGSVLDMIDATAQTGPLTGRGASFTGAAGSAFVAFPIAASADGTTVAATYSPELLTQTTGHTWFQIAGATGDRWVQGVVTLGSTSPTITDALGQTWEQVAQVAIGTAGHLTVWTAVLNRDFPTTEHVALSETCDSGVGFRAYV